jgi:hypothetical protein
MPAFYRFKKIVFSVFLGLLFHSICYGQSWRYNDSVASIGWNVIEFNADIVVSTVSTNSINGLSEPTIIILSSTGIKEKTIMIPLSDYGLNRGVFTGMAVNSNDTLALCGLAFSRFDSAAHLVTVLLNNTYQILGLSYRKIELENIRIPSRGYTAKVSLHFDNVSNTYYGSTSICATKLDDNAAPILNSYSLPCAHLFFIASNSGEIIKIESVPVNINGLDKYLLNQSNIELAKLETGGYLSNSFTEGLIEFTDSFEIIAKSAPKINKYLPNNYSNDFIRVNQFYYLFGLVSFSEVKREGAITFDIEHSRILVQKFSLKGDLILEKVFYPILLSDSCSWTKFENGNYIDSYQARLINAIIKGAAKTSDEGLLFSYRNQTGKLFTFKIDTNLDLKWAKTITMGYFNFYGLTSSKDTSCVLSGWSSFPAGAELPMFAIKLAPNGYLSTVNSLDGLNKPLILYPNPCDESISLKFEDDKFENFYIYIYDSNGSEVLFHRLSGGSSIDTSSLKPGLYFCYIINEMQQKRTFKIIKI